MTENQQIHWEHFEHRADIGVRGIGPTKEAAFEQAALALTAVITDPADVKTETTIEFQSDAPDDELLLADFLNCLIYEMNTRDMLFSQFHVTIEGDKLSATAAGQKTDRIAHQPAVEVKAATYSELKVAKTKTGNWIAQCIVDV